MIRYRKQIQVKTTRNGDIVLETDLGQTWRTIEMSGKTAMTEWIVNSAQGNLQHWQKDMAKVVLDAFVHDLQDEHVYTVYKVYQKGQGYMSRASDVFLMRIKHLNVWFLSTTNNTWIFQEILENFPLMVEDAESSILDLEVREQLYTWSDKQRGIKPKKKQIVYNDEDYAAKGLI